MGTKRPHAALPSCWGALGRDRERGYAPDEDFDISAWRDRRRRGPQPVPANLESLPSVALVAALPEATVAEADDQRRFGGARSHRSRAALVLRARRMPRRPSLRTARGPHAAAHEHRGVGLVGAAIRRTGAVLGRSGAPRRSGTPGRESRQKPPGRPVCKKLRLLPARVPISMRWLKMPRISPLRRKRRPGHTAPVVTGV
jgi:hypothetical protein